MDIPHRTCWIAGLGVLLLAGLGIASVLVGSGDLSPRDAWAVLDSTSTSAADRAIIHDLRLPRLPVALIAGAGLGAAGALTQTLTRNPLAEPGLLGVNAGAALAVSIGMLFTTSLGPAGTVLLALGGASAVGLGVLLIGGLLRGRRDTTRLVLSGAALSAVASALTSWLVVSNPRAFTQFRHWDAGAIEPRPRGLVCLALALALLAAGSVAIVQPDLDALALGDDMATSLGARPRLAWALAGGAAIVLCATSTALAGPIGFLGLVAPQIVRRLMGPRITPLLLGSAVAGACVLLAADILGRVLIPPREVAASIVCSLVGAPVFVLVARRMRLVAL